MEKHKIIEICGLPDTGKTRFILNKIHEIQQADPENICLYADFDNKMNKEWIYLNHLDKNRIIFVFCIKDMLNILNTCGNTINTVVIDSLPMAREYNLDLLLSQLRKYADSYGSVYLINQVRYNMNNDMVAPYCGNITKKYINKRITLYHDGSLFINDYKVKKNKEIEKLDSYNSILNMITSLRESAFSIY